MARSLSFGIPIAFPIESSIGAWPDLPMGQQWAVLALWEANKAARNDGIDNFRLPRGATL